MLQFVDSVDFLIIFQPFPEMDPTYSTPVRAPPTETPLGDDEDGDDVEETSGQEMEMSTVRGKEKNKVSYISF